MVFFNTSNKGVRWIVSGCWLELPSSANICSNAKSKHARWCNVPTEGCLTCKHTNSLCRPPGFTFDPFRLFLALQSERYILQSKRWEKKKQQTPTSLWKREARKGIASRGSGLIYQTPVGPHQWVGITVKRPINERPIVSGAERTQQ